MAIEENVRYSSDVKRCAQQIVKEFLVASRIFRTFECSGHLV